ncbi:transcription elongation protein SprT [Roseivirga pacifica]|uniref:transcription elongation protein SprT n=1 Tax=Roseivirga pacifica TaxID=1267423 RepID=UPI002094BAA6|nr:transcription elongation protein SprT [Roseivirga pacifica]MCO6359020.1 transcription elongation protein SprT [Roseivirga pacifica]MCO6365344.1 transcription elongation protein SprT [Roseivirga pacifica]MCO6371926.1 transcription elongation protein SprT [Roseivirga pacifica]MCO6375963.1 transcription elongation protein SprT [Roseivirga pacifica]MCO6379304.1 transcription elongation protein SprT [Roseivirga pacifica]
MTSDLRELFARKVPLSAVEYCVSLWEDAPFRFKLTRARKSKLGDYRYDPRDRSHQVSVNADLNQYQFLITYVHEVAHRRVHDPKRRLKPHGDHWKLAFRNLMLPLLNEAVFPDDVLRPLARHMKNPKASTAADPVLLKAVSAYDLNKAQGKTLNEVALGEVFELRKRKFKKLETKRTRALCLDLSNNRRYLISLVAEVE